MGVTKYSGQYRISWTAATVYEVHCSEEYDLASAACDHTPFLNNEVDVPQCHVLDLRLSGEQGDQRRGQLLQQGVVVVRVLGQQLQELHQHLDSRQDHC